MDFAPLSFSVLDFRNLLGLRVDDVLDLLNKLMFNIIFLAIDGTSQPEASSSILTFKKKNLAPFMKLARSCFVQWLATSTMHLFMSCVRLEITI